MFKYIDQLIKLLYDCKSTETETDRLKERKIKWQTEEAPTQNDGRFNRQMNKLQTESGNEREKE